MAQQHDKTAAPAPLPTNQTNDANTDTPTAPSIEEISKTKSKATSHLNELVEEKEEKDEAKKDSAKQEAEELINFIKTSHNMGQYNAELMAKYLKNIPKIAEPWIEEEAPYKQTGLVKIGKLIQISQNEFFIVPPSEPLVDNNFNIKNNGIWKYNVDTKQWQLIFEYPQDFISEYPSVAYDKSTEILYISTTISGIHKLDLKAKTIKALGVAAVPLGYMERGTNGKLYCIDGELQHFMGHDENRHLRWDDDENLYSVVKEFEEYKAHGLSGFGMVYNNRANELLFMGGWKGKGQGRSDAIWRFSMDTKRSAKGQMLGWHKLDTKMPDEMQSFACVLSGDCQNVLIFGGSDSKGISRKIRILNLESMKWRVSKIEIPFKTIADGSVILMRKEADNILVKGYLREQEKELRVQGWVVDIELVIFDFFVNEEVHVTQGGYRHARIALTDILYA